MHKLIQKIDNLLLQGRYQNFRYRNKLSKKLKNFALNFDTHSSSFYSGNRHDNLAALCDEYGSDKGSNLSVSSTYSWPAHTYTNFYSLLFAHCREHILKVCECGLGTNNPNLASSMGPKGRPGASLRVWRDYFPNAQIYGADIDRDILFHEERIKTFFVDQQDPAKIRDFWVEVGEDNFDLIIDDGLHTYEAGSTFFQHSIDKLSPRGLWVIEDVNLDDLPKYEKFFDHQAFNVFYHAMHNVGQRRGDNNLILVRKS